MKHLHGSIFWMNITLFAIGLILGTCPNVNETVSMAAHTDQLYNKLYFKCLTFVHVYQRNKTATV